MAEKKDGDMSDAEEITRTGIKRAIIPVILEVMHVMIWEGMGSAMKCKTKKLSEDSN